MVLRNLFFHGGCHPVLNGQCANKSVSLQVAKASYKVKQDPLDAAIFYLAMKKKSLVWGLFRSKRDERMTHFFSNNFSEDRWRKAALKNAFALLGKQRFEHAAAFFLLAGALRDAIEVLLFYTYFFYFTSFHHHFYCKIM